MRAYSIWSSFPVRLKVVSEKLYAESPILPPVCSRSGNYTTVTVKRRCDTVQRDVEQWQALPMALSDFVSTRSALIQAVQAQSSASVRVAAVELVRAKPLYSVNERALLCTENPFPIPIFHVAEIEVS